jgi:hypothetical protein
MLIMMMSGSFLITNSMKIVCSQLRGTGIFGPENGTGILIGINRQNQAVIPPQILLLLG